MTYRTRYLLTLSLALPLLGGCLCDAFMIVEGRVTGDWGAGEAPIEGATVFVKPAEDPPSEVDEPTLPRTPANGAFSELYSFGGPCFLPPSGRNPVAYIEAPGFCPVSVPVRPPKLPTPGVTRGDCLSRRKGCYRLDVKLQPVPPSGAESCAEASAASNSAR